MTTPNETWFPRFEQADWAYDSFLLGERSGRGPAASTTTPSVRRWARGKLLCGQAFGSATSYTLRGKLVLEQDVEFDLAAIGRPGSNADPATFEATAIGLSGAYKGVVAKLVGWAFPVLPIRESSAKVFCVRGSAWAVRGPDTDPCRGSDSVALNTVGMFVIARALANTEDQRNEI